MNWKEFLKPTKAKVVLFFAVFLLFVPFIEYSTGIVCIKAPCPSSAIGSFVQYALFSYKLIIYGIMPLHLLAGIALSYLASCAIAFFARSRNPKQ